MRDLPRAPEVAPVACLLFLDGWLVGEGHHTQFNMQGAVAKEKVQLKRRVVWCALAICMSNWTKSAGKRKQRHTCKPSPAMVDMDKGRYGDYCDPFTLAYRPQSSSPKP
jgi:hypothetical protein